MENTMIENPMATDGFAFLEFCSTDLSKLHHDFKALGFAEPENVPNKKITLLRQNKIDFRINAQDDYAIHFAEKHGASACAMGFKVKNAQYAHQRALQLGAENVREKTSYPYPAIYGIGGSLLYFVDESLCPDHVHSTGHLVEIDHVTHNVNRGAMNKWAEFYETLFNFREIRYFDIQGKKNRSSFACDDQPLR